MIIFSHNILPHIINEIYISTNHLQPKENEHHTNFLTSIQTWRFYYKKNGYIQPINMIFLLQLSFFLKDLQ